VQTQSNVLFLGDSHTAGYVTSGDEYQLWQENNYAQIFAEELANGQCYIYGYSGAPNQVYPRWVRHMLNKHSNISAVVIQSTYWDRWLMGTSANIGFDQLSIDHFTNTVKVEEKYICYDDNYLTDDNIEWSDKVKFFNDNRPNSNWPGAFPILEWPGDHNQYYHTKFHHELLTHLTCDTYVRNVALIDAMCAERNIPCFIWRINDRVELPDDANVYRILTHTNIFRMPANYWVLENLNIDIEQMKVDIEHYNKEAHTLLAKHFIPELLNGTS